MVAFWRRLGLPGLVDLHVHFMPDRVLRKVWAFFDGAGARTGTEWPITYRVDEAARLRLVRDFGLRAFPSLLYPHRPAMAQWLNDWAAGFAAEHPDVIPTATFYPEPSAGDYVQSALDSGARIFKAHLQVGAYDPRDPLLDPVWGAIAEAQVPVVTHCGSGPNPGPFTGPGPISAVLARHPTLCLVIAHLGMPEYREHLQLAQRYPRVHLDTTMVGTDFVEARMPLPRWLRPLLADLGDRIVLGSDFPNIPYPYAHQLQALERLELGEQWLRAVLHDNGARLAGLVRPN